jgi:hypothetical protein
VQSVVGAVSLTFSDSRNANFTWQIGDRFGDESIEKNNFSSLPTELPFTGVWYDPEEPGYGITINTQGATRAIVIYFYDNENQPRWVLITQDNIRNSTGEAISLTGPCPWCEFSPAVVSDGGSMSLNFSDWLNASADFEVFLSTPENGVWRRKDVKLSRLTAEPNHRPFQ